MINKSDIEILSKKIKNSISQNYSKNINSKKEFSKLLTEDINTNVSNNTNNDKYLSDLSDLFIKEILKQNLSIEGNLYCSSIEVDEILIKSIDEESDLSNIDFQNLNSNNISNYSSININSSLVNNSVITNSKINSNLYYQSLEPSFTINSNIIPTTKNESGWIGSSYIRNLRTSLNETSSNNFKIDILGESIFKTTDGNMVLTTESNSNISNINILSNNNITISSNQGNILFNLNNNNYIDFTINNESFLNIDPNKGIKGLKLNYNNLNDTISNENSINLSSYDSNSIILLNLNNRENPIINLPNINNTGVHYKIDFLDNISINNNFTLLANNSSYIYGFIIYYNDTFNTIGNKNNLVNKISIKSEKDIDLTGTSIDLYSNGVNWNISIYCSEIKENNIVTLSNKID
jgi:hypothetical protein